MNGLRSRSDDFLAAAAAVVVFFGFFLFLPVAL
jgi:hypothetical protein